MSNGKSSVVEEEYDKAIDYFDLALEAKKDDKEATNYVLGDEPQYINGKKVYHVELWDYVAEDDWWMHQTCFISKDGLE